MNQLTQQLKDGTMEILEVPMPALGKNQVLVKNLYSVISAGTEGKTVSDARLGYIGKARSRQKEVKAVIDMIKVNGFKESYRIVMNKLEAPAAMGYCSAGEVIAVGENVTNFKVGEMVACAGLEASHAEIVSVSKNLCAKIPQNVSVKQASLATIAAIAMQGIRQAELNIGENCVVIGLGLIGQLTVQMLRAAGVKVVAVDIDERQVQLSKISRANLSVNRNQAGIEEMILDFTNGYGTDAVIITAGTSSIDPVEFSGRISRKKGKVVIVGAVPTGFSREHYYRKELDLRMSSSYGPGRYDLNYEEKGQDYPIGYVRWTENRNMLSYIDLLSQEKLNIEPLITHTFSLDDAPKAYQMIVEKSENYVGIVIEYDEKADISKKKVQLKTSNAQSNEKVKIAFIGAGSFAQNMLLPNLGDKVAKLGVVTSHGNTGLNVSRKFGFDWCSSDANEVYQNKDVNTVFIATRHNLHAQEVIESLKSGKNVFVEKPLCLSLDELKEIKTVYSESNKQLLVGFNRRFSPHIKHVKKYMRDDQPKAINYRINSGSIPADNWIQDAEIGGGRILGEVCHFIDLARFVAGSAIKTVNAFAIPDKQNLNDCVTVSLSFENGSIAQIGYFANGNKSLAKEYFEVFWQGNIAIIDDFRKTTVTGGRVNSKLKTNLDKGHKNELQEFISALSDGKSCPISFDEIYEVTLASFAAIESLKRGVSIRLEDFSD